MMSIRHTLEAGQAPSAAPDPVLDAARESILAVGFRRTTLTDVARRAGVSRMTIYRRFADMKALLAELLVREWGELLASTPMLDPREVTAASLAQSVTDMVRALREDPLFARIVEVDPELLLPYVLERRGRNQELLRELLTDAVRAGQEAGTVRPVDPDLLARSILLSAQGFLLSSAIMTDSHIDQAALDSELRHLLERHLAP
jgi:AcrR family transcriptional regulator